MKKKAKKSKSLSVATVVSVATTVFAFLGSLLKVASYFWDPSERERRRIEAALKQNEADLNKVNNAIDDNNEDDLNESLDKISKRRKKTDALKKGKNKCKKSLRYTRYC